MEAQEKVVLLEAVKTVLGNSLSDRDIALIADRKAQVDYFGRLLVDQEFFDHEAQELDRGPEGLWQRFFEDNKWIFGYGLSLVTHDSFGDGKLERITTGADFFSGAGKRTDALMRARAEIGTLLFCEIKTHKTPLLAKKLYREPDVYRPSDELSGGAAQLQKTVRKALRDLSHQIEEFVTADGTRTGLEFSTTHPRQVLVIGSLGQLQSNGHFNREMVESFELYRKSILGMDIVTFDELYERSRFIVEG